MVHPERHTRHEPFHDYAARDKLCREIEREYSLIVDNGREQRRENALTHKAVTIEAQTGQESFESYAKRHKEKILAALEHATQWQDLHDALKAHGLTPPRIGNGGLPDIQKFGQLDLRSAFGGFKDAAVL